VITAYSGEECLKKLDESMPDAVLLDIMMPEMDGWKYSKDQGKVREPARSNAHVRNQDIDIMLGLHVLKADDYITKPLEKRPGLKESKSW